MKIDKQALGYLLAFGSAAAGALRYNLAVYAEGYGFEYIPFLAWALVVGLIASSAHVLVRDGVSGLRPPAGKFHHALLYGLLMGWSTLAHFLALDAALNETTMTSLGQTGILISLMLAAVLLGERLTRPELYATAVILVGMFLFRPWESDHREAFLILMSGLVCGSLASVNAKRWVTGTPPRLLMVWRNLVAAALVFAFNIGGPTPEVTMATAIACIACGILGPYLHGLFFLQSLERISASRATLMGRVQPVIVFFASWIFLSRIPAQKELISAAVILVGTIWLVLVRPAPKK
ncbi:MAG: DMT family transporter [Planctomycetota bacterium]|jgi:drug/metabolite transporter (DMT)-like permease